MGRDMYACPIAAGFVLAPSIAWTAKVAVTVVVGQTVVMMMMMTMAGGDNNRSHKNNLH